MLLRALSVAVLGLGSFAAGQDVSETPKPEQKKPPSLDVERWRAGGFDQTQRRRNFFRTPERTVTPGTLAGTADRKCSIPLTELRPRVTPRMKTFPPGQQGHIRFLDPPAPVCDQAEPRNHSQPQPR